MKTFVCRNCDAEVRRPTAPLKCDACGQQRIGLFKEMPAGPPAQSTAGPPAAPTEAGQTAPPPAASPPPVAPAPPSPPPGAPSTLQQPAAASTAAPDPRPPGPPLVPEASADTDPAAPADSESTAPSPEQTPPEQTPTPPVPKQPTTAQPSAPSPASQADSAPPAPGPIAWTFPTYIPGQDLLRTALRNCVAVDSEDQAYAAIGKKLIAFTGDGPEAEVIWEYDTQGQIPGSPSIGPDGRIRVHSSDGRLHCISKTGEAAWSPVKIGKPLGWPSPVVDEDNNTWICRYEGGLLRVDGKGSKKDRPFFYSRQRFDSTPLINRSVLYVGGEDGFIYAIKLDGTRGKNLWDHMADRGKTDWFINSGPALMVEDTLVVAGRDEYLYGFNLDGSPNWKLHIRGQMLASPVVDADDYIYVGLSLVRRGHTDRGKIVSVEGSSQRVRWEYETSGAVESTPIIGDDGTVYVGDNAGVIHAINPAGQALWTVQSEAAIRSGGAMLPGGRIVFGSDGGVLVCIQTDSKHLAESRWPKYMGSAAQSGGI